MNCNIKFPADAKLEYLWSDAEGVLDAHCEFNGNMLRNDAPYGIQFESYVGDTIFGEMHCAFKVTFSDGNFCDCEVTTRNEHFYMGAGRYSIYNRWGCGCMRIKRCEGKQCPGDGNTGQWPCRGDDGVGCKQAPQVTLTVESSWK